MATRKANGRQAAVKQVRGRRLSKVQRLAEEAEETKAIGRKRAAGKDAKKEKLTITAPNFKTMRLKITGTTDYVQHRFGSRPKKYIHDTQQKGHQGKKGQKREPKDFMACYEDAMHVSTDGWYGIPAPAFRAAMVSACRIVGFKMTLAKLGAFIEADGYGREDATPLVKITKGKPRYTEMAVRNETGVVDLRARPAFAPGWEAIVTIRFDADMFSAQDVVNLMMRVGQQVGIGEGRPDSKKSCGMGWGLFMPTKGAA